MPLIAYYRVSTPEQGVSGLGLEAQRAAVHRYALLVGESIRAEFTDILSSRKDRPEFNAALEMALQYRDTLTVARLDRLSRDLHAITSLQKSGVKFLSVDMPGAEKMVIQMMGVIAEYERDTTSARTKGALAAAKARGVKLGSPDPMKAIAAVTYERSAAAEEFRSQLRPEIQTMRRNGATLQGIADHLNGQRIPTPGGNGQWCPKKVSNVLKRPNGLTLMPAHDAGDVQPANDQAEAEQLPLFAHAAS
jgi:DNA invertase Pin-like site-specific DNA recombinase